MTDALVGSAEVREVAADLQERTDLHPAPTDRTREGERLLTDRKRLIETPGELQPVRERR